MKICIVGNVAEYLKGTGMGGAKRQISLLAQRLALRGHQVTCFIMIAQYCHLIDLLNCPNLIPYDQEISDDK